MVACPHSLSSMSTRQMMHSRVHLTISWPNGECQVAGSTASGQAFSNFLNAASMITKGSNTKALDTPAKNTCHGGWNKMSIRHPCMVDEYRAHSAEKVPCSSARWVFDWRPPFGPGGGAARKGACPKKGRPMQSIDHAFFSLPTS
jgi:hypothetical protein